VDFKIHDTPTVVQVFQSRTSLPKTRDQTAYANLSISAAMPPLFAGTSVDPDRQKRLTNAHHAAYMMVKTAD